MVAWASDGLHDRCITQRSAQNKEVLHMSASDNGARVRITTGWENQ